MIIVPDYLPINMKLRTLGCSCLTVCNIQRVHSTLSNMRRPDAATKNTRRIYRTQDINSHIRRSSARPGRRYSRRLPLYGMEPRWRRICPFAHSYEAEAGHWRTPGAIQERKKTPMEYYIGVLLCHHPLKIKIKIKSAIKLSLSCQSTEQIATGKNIFLIPVIDLLPSSLFFCSVPGSLSRFHCATATTTTAPVQALPKTFFFASLLISRPSFCYSFSSVQGYLRWYVFDLDDEN